MARLKKTDSASVKNTGKNDEEKIVVKGREFTPTTKANVSSSKGKKKNEKETTSKGKRGRPAIKKALKIKMKRRPSKSNKAPTKKKTDKLTKEEIEFLKATKASKTDEKTTTSAVVKVEQVEEEVVQEEVVQDEVVPLAATFDDGISALAAASSSIKAGLKTAVKSGKYKRKNARKSTKASASKSNQKKKEEKKKEVAAVEDEAVLHKSPVKMEVSNEIFNFGDFDNNIVSNEVVCGSNDDEIAVSNELTVISSEVTVGEGEEEVEIPLPTTVDDDDDDEILVVNEDEDPPQDEATPAASVESTSSPELGQQAAGNVKTITAVSSTVATTTTGVSVVTTSGVVYTTDSAGDVADVVKQDVVITTSSGTPVVFSNDEDISNEIAEIAAAADITVTDDVAVDEKKTSTTEEEEFEMFDGQCVVEIIKDDQTADDILMQSMIDIIKDVDEPSVIEIIHDAESSAYTSSESESIRIRDVNDINDLQFDEKDNTIRITGVKTKGTIPVTYDWKPFKTGRKRRNHHNQENKPQVKILKSRYTGVDVNSARDPKHSSKLNQVIKRLTEKELKKGDSDIQSDGSQQQQTKRPASKSNGILKAQPKVYVNEKGEQVEDTPNKKGQTRDFKCTVCGKLFLTCTHLTRHFEVHSEKKNYKCTVCNKQFYQAGSLAKHMHIHTAPEGYSCTVCSKKFTQKSSLVRHMNLHTGEKAFRCEVCKKTFRRRYAYDAHKIRHVKN